jgi:methanethiol S-methyltransferase
MSNQDLSTKAGQLHYLMSGWIARNYPGVDPLAHDSGHLLHTLLRLPGDPHFDPLHILSNVLIVAGFWLLASSWNGLYRAQREHKLATSGPYARVRHPQYDGFIVIMLGFLLQWPTIVTLVMFPVLVWMYVRLARSEEREATLEFGDAYVQYAAVTPAFIPHLHSGAAGTLTRTRALGPHRIPPRADGR